MPTEAWQASKGERHPHQPSIEQEQFLLPTTDTDGYRYR